MDLTQRSWLGCCALVTVAVAVVGLGTQMPPPLPEAPLPEAKTDQATLTPLQGEFETFRESLVRWIDDGDAVSRARSLSSAAVLRRMLVEQGDTQGLPARSTGTMVASLRAGLQALSIQDRLIELAEQDVRRNETPASVARLVKAHQVREEIVTKMIEPAVRLVDSAISASPPLLRARAE